MRKKGGKVGVWATVAGGHPAICQCQSHVTTNTMYNATLTLKNSIDHFSAFFFRLLLFRLLSFPRKITMSQMTLNMRINARLQLIIITDLNGSQDVYHIDKILLSFAGMVFFMETK